MGTFIFCLSTLKQIKSLFHLWGCNLNWLANNLTNIVSLSVFSLLRHPGARTDVSHMLGILGISNRGLCDATKGQFQDSVSAALPSSRRELLHHNELLLAAHLCSQGLRFDLYSVRVTTNDPCQDTRGINLLHFPCAYKLKLIYIKIIRAPKEEAGTTLGCGWKHDPKRILMSLWVNK